MTPLPAWIDQDAWTGYVEMRQRQEVKSRGKIAWTSRAEKLVLAELYKLKDKGHDPNASLDQSTLKGWTDVYPNAGKEIPNVNRTYTNGQRDQMTEAEKVAADEARRGVMAKRLRSVA